MKLKRIIALSLSAAALALSLSACGGAEGGNRAEQLALDIRGEYLEMGGCTASL